MSECHVWYYESAHGDSQCFINAESQANIRSLKTIFTVSIFYVSNFQGGDVVCEQRDDKKDLVDIKSAMKVLMFTDDEIWDIFKILAAVLHLGNVSYKGIVVDNIDASEIVGVDNVAKAARLLEVSCLM